MADGWQLRREAMRQNKVKQMWRDGRATVGSWLSLGNPLAAEIMAHQGFDWLTVDLEHNAIDLSQAQACFQAIATTDTVALGISMPTADLPGIGASTRTAIGET